MDKSTDDMKDNVDEGIGKKCKTGKNAQKNGRQRPREEAEIDRGRTDEKRNKTKRTQNL